MDQLLALECVEARSCDGCKIATYSEANDLTHNQRLRLMRAATTAGWTIRTGEDPEVAIIYAQEAGLTSEEARVAVEGYIQWNEKDCREIPQL